MTIFRKLKKLPLGYFKKIHHFRKQDGRYSCDLARALAVVRSEAFKIRTAIR